MLNQDVSSQLLEFIGIVTIPAAIVPFIARDNFVVGNAGIVYMNG